MLWWQDSQLRDELWELSSIAWWITHFFYFLISSFDRWTCSCLQSERVEINHGVQQVTVYGSSDYAWASQRSYNKLEKYGSSRSDLPVKPINHCLSRNAVSFSVAITMAKEPNIKRPRLISPRGVIPCHGHVGCMMMSQYGMSKVNLNKSLLCT